MNIEAPREFVVHVVEFDNRERMNVCSPECPAEVSERDIAQITVEPSAKVKPPRIVKCPIHLECVASRIHNIAGATYRLLWVRSSTRIAAMACLTNDCI